MDELLKKKFRPEQISADQIKELEMHFHGKFVSYYNSMLDAEENRIQLQQKITEMKIFNSYLD